MTTARDTGLPFGRYVLRELIARGGMGEVFRAVAVGAGGFEKPVVVKRILPQLGGSETHAEMFIAEARLMSRLSHPNIVQVIDFGRGESDDYFLVMELVDGVDLRAFYKHYESEPMPLGLGLYIVSQMLRGLHHAHEKAESLLVHRDVSPGNVLLSRVGEVKVADFGVALVTGDEPSTLAGKLGYMAPEQHRGDRLDARADVFSCGVVLFQILSGELPFAGDTAEERQADASRGMYRSLRALRDDVPVEVEAIIDQALSPNREHRFASARAMGKAIEAVCDADPRMAKSDDLAEAVERVVAAGGARAKPVLALGHRVGLAEGTVVARDVESRFTRVASLTSATELTEATELSASEPLAPKATEGPTETLAPLPRESPRGLYAVAVLVVGLAAVAAVVAFQGDPPPSPEETRASAATSSQPSRDPQTATQEIEAHAEAAVETTTPPVPATAVRGTRTPPTLATTSTRPAAPPPTPVGDCRGSVLLAGKGSWWVVGGPSKVQAPGQYEWPCGGYGLTATSRVDGRVISRSITVRQGQPTAARFE